MISNTANLSVISRRKDGGLVVIDEAGRISVIAVENDCLVRSSNGNKDILIEGDPALAENVLSSLAARGDAQSLRRSGTSPLAIIAAGAALFVVVIASAILLSILFEPRAPLWTSPAQQTQIAPADIPAPAGPSESEPTPQLPEPPRSPENTSAATPPPQPDVPLPTTLIVDPESSVGVTPMSESDPEPAGTDTQAPTGEVNTPQERNVETEGTEDASTLQSRADATLEQLNDIHETARTSVTEGGLENADEEIARMQEALRILESGEKLTPEMVSRLPHEVAAELQAQGVVMTPEEYQLALMATGDTDAPRFSITRLPPSVVDRYRDADGVATIPDSNSWATAGGGVSLPLPGGGDIRSAADFATFGLNP